MARTKYLQAEGESPRPPASSRRSGRSALALPTSPRSDTASGKALESLRHTSSIGLRGGQYDGAATEVQPLASQPSRSPPPTPALWKGALSSITTAGLLALSASRASALQVGYDLPGRKPRSIRRREGRPNRCYPTD